MVWKKQNRVVDYFSTFSIKKWTLKSSPIWISSNPSVKFKFGWASMECPYKSRTLELSRTFESYYLLCFLREGRVLRFLVQCVVGRDWCVVSKE